MNEVKDPFPKNDSGKGFFVTLRMTGGEIGVSTDKKLPDTNPAFAEMV